MMGGAWFTELFGEPGQCDVSVFEEAAIKAVAEQLKVTSQPSKALVKVHKVSAAADCGPIHSHVHQTTRISMRAFTLEASNLFKLLAQVTCF